MKIELHQHGKSNRLSIRVLTEVLEINDQAPWLCQLAGLVWKTSELFWPQRHRCAVGIANGAAGIFRRWLGHRVSDAMYRNPRFSSKRTTAERRQVSSSCNHTSQANIKQNISNYICVYVYTQNYHRTS